MQIPGIAVYAIWNPLPVLTLESEWNFTQAVGPVVDRGAGVLVLQYLFNTGLVSRPPSRICR